MADGRGDGFQSGTVSFPQVRMLGDGRVFGVEPLGRRVKQVEAFRHDAGDYFRRDSAARTASCTMALYATTVACFPVRAMRAMPKGTTGASL